MRGNDYEGGAVDRGEHGSNRGARLVRASVNSVLESQGGVGLSPRLKAMTDDMSRRVRIAFASIAFALLGAGWMAGYLQAVIVRECWFNAGCVRETLMPFFGQKPPAVFE